MYWLFCSLWYLSNQCNQCHLQTYSLPQPDIFYYGSAGSSIVFHYNLACLQTICTKYKTDWANPEEISINRFNFYRANIPDKAGLRGTTAKTISDSKIHETVHEVNGPFGVLVTMGKQSASRRLLGCNSKMPLHWCWSQPWELIPLWDLKEQVGSDVASMDCT